MSFQIQMKHNINFEFWPNGKQWMGIHMNIDNRAGECRCENVFKFYKHRKVAFRVLTFVRLFFFSFFHSSYIVTKEVKKILFFNKLTLYIWCLFDIITGICLLYPIFNKWIFTWDELKILEMHLMATENQVKKH